ncbi:hypothetical protein [Hungatella effluvii]|jgi:chemotaxis protein|uniref:hypothetical protein n=1 Tax=Hungatella effluvii TaxID=1096246 RepID=UPI002A8218B0|nr:hypothetical protein [Hungatella effluvii]
MYEIRLTGGEKIKVNTAKSIDEMLEWLNGICDEGFEFVGLTQPDGKTVMIRVSEIRTITKLLARRNLLGVIFSPFWYPRRKRGRHHRTRPGKQVKMNRKE